MNSEPIKIFFSQSHNEQLSLEADENAAGRFSALKRILSDLGYMIAATSEQLTAEQLSGVHVLVIGAPQFDREHPEQATVQNKEIDIVKTFLERGGGLLLLANAETMYYPPDGLNELAALGGVRFQEYHNYPITYLQVFYPHYVTGNVQRVKVGRIASLTVEKGARCLAQTKTTEQPVLACAQVGSGRMVVLCDTGLFADDVFAEYDNSQLACNIFHWLTFQNALDIAEFVMPATVKWGQTATATLTLHNLDAQARPNVRCEMQSNLCAKIPDRELLS